MIGDCYLPLYGSLGPAKKRECALSFTALGQVAQHTVVAQTESAFSWHSLAIIVRFSLFVKQDSATTAMKNRCPEKGDDITVILHAEPPTPYSLLAPPVFSGYNRPAEPK